MIRDYDFQRYAMLKAQFEEYHKRTNPEMTNVSMIKLICSLIVYGIVLINMLYHLIFMNYMMIVIMVVSAHLLADFFSGVIHWVCDSYDVHPFLTNTPVINIFGNLMQNVFDAFKLHHHKPSSIVHHDMTIHSLSLLMLCDTFICILLFCGGKSNPICIFFSMITSIVSWANVMHKFSHMKNSDKPIWVRILQSTGFVLTNDKHKLHHVINRELQSYTILWGGLNPILDHADVRFWERSESLIYRIFGIKSYRMLLKE